MPKRKKPGDSVQLPHLSQLSQSSREQIKEIQAELSTRSIEAIKMYRPTPTQEEMHKCKASEVLVLGGNRSGKSLSTFMEDARAATGQDPYGKYPDKDGTLVIVGRDWKHIGMVVYPMLMKAGSFKIIKDAGTGQWRAFDPVGDEARKEEAKPAPPMIPPRFIKKITWLLKSANYIQSCELHNGWMIYFCSSEGDPPQGFQADRVHLDEDVANEQWVPEMQARLADRKGRLVWSAMPHSKNDALLGLSERADAQAEANRENPDIVKFVLRFLDNPHIDDEEKRKNVERWSAMGQDVLRMRAEGEFITDSVMCYPTFAMAVHGYDRAELPQNVVPPDWCRYVAVDPGHAVTAALFAAVPPDDSMMLIYDELYIRQCNAVLFGEAMQRKCEGQHFHAFIIDMHGGRIREIGSGRLPVDIYCEQLRQRNIRSQVTGSAFLAGSDDVQGRMQETQRYMHIRGDGTPTIRILRGAVPNLEREMKKYRKKTVYQAGTMIVTDAPNTKGDVHACQCLEYLCAARPKYHKPPNPNHEAEPWWVAWKKRRDKEARKEARNFVWLGPGG
jgi:hypothetical protein